ncbi:proton-coupled amino acid transporter-like protein CG1139 [Photinus pyralis]|uniref:proton-coupled amino acid transporter-like protein CG1139 n=1 Tax=Photinus pyralis TaxID=7054 RepID=UPI0012671BF9|nr:proton-coupled amino acid transporter-like protein CG1139 [Photinus pyralis]
MTLAVKGEYLNTGFVPDCTIDVKRREAKENESRGLYDPYAHRKVSHPTTNWETLIHLLKGSCGTGILAMPKAISNSGYVIGTIGTFAIGFICTYCIHLLINCEYELCKRRKVPSLTYPGIAEEALAEGPKPLRKLASYAGHFVNVFLLIYQFGTCCVYIVFIGVNIQAVANQYVTEIAVEYYMLMILLPLILVNWIRNLKTLAPLSTFANFITVGSFAIVLYYLFTTGFTFEDREAVANVKTLPLFFGTVLFSLEAIGVIIPLENEMKSPKSFGSAFGVLNVGMGSIVLLYAVIGLLGYLTYGSSVEGSITLSLPKEDVAAQVCKLALALAMFLTYTVQYYVAIDITWTQYLGTLFEDNRRKRVYEYGARTILVLLTFVLAVSVPALDLFISFFGALSLSLVGIAVPAMIETCTFWYHRQGWRFYFMVITNVSLIAFSLLGLVAGTFTSLSEIIYTFSNKS